MSLSSAPFFSLFLCHHISKNVSMGEKLCKEHFSYFIVVYTSIIYPQFHTKTWHNTTRLNKIFFYFIFYTLIMIKDIKFPFFFLCFETIYFEIASIITFMFLFRFSIFCTLHSHNSHQIEFEWRINEKNRPTRRRRKNEILDQHDKNEDDFGRLEFYHFRESFSQW
jgi:hypothetical protein